MKVSADIDISADNSRVWETITDIAASPDFISEIKELEILHRPHTGLVGLKWRETREMFGRDSSETMWISEAEAPRFYRTRAESHGSVYLSTLSLVELNGTTRLTMSFEGQPRSLAAKALSLLLGPMIKGATRKALLRDLEDIKRHIESEGPEQPPALKV